MPLVKLRKRIVRMKEECNYRNQTEPIFQEMKLLTLSHIYFFETARFMHRFLLGPACLLVLHFWIII